MEGRIDEKLELRMTTFLMCGDWKNYENITETTYEIKNTGLEK